MKKVLLIGLGIISLVVGAIGAVVPLLPSFPFLLLAGICFTKSSKKLDDWFKSTSLYKNNLEDYVSGRGMSKKAKLRVMLTITLVMLFGFIMMRNLFVPRIILFIVWIAHILYFLFKVKTNDESI